MVRARRHVDVGSETRGVLHTTGAIVLNHADVCTVHYVHNGREPLAQDECSATNLRIA